MTLHGGMSNYFFLLKKNTLKPSHANTKGYLVCYLQSVRGRKKPLASFYVTGQQNVGNAVLITDCQHKKRLNAEGKGKGFPEVLIKALGKNNDASLNVTSRPAGEAKTASS